jgi:hypothetical protein
MHPKPYSAGSERFNQTPSSLDFLFLNPSCFNGVMRLLLKALPCGFILSTWHSNEFRTNATLGRNWKCPGIHVLTREHFYHVGSSEDLRHPMVEALITNCAVEQPAPQAGETAEQMAFFERR